MTSLLWGNTATVVFEKGEKIIQILLKAGFAIKKSKVAQATEGEGGSSQLAELKAVQLALDIVEREKWSKLYLYTDLWMVDNALWVLAGKVEKGQLAA
ncbi:hypothetical protein DUI87_03087 [Hirundo rustica rustica]|uniref:RNase H type-1 domain-containing protein n=1 Tax=Hirundo rustica rustica TaxID=333673 RepID=A0A3M0L950_HIRRU|nr:hypothetical protein DUI87_03087 [Hirundo rustica rustica]